MLPVPVRLARAAFALALLVVGSLLVRPAAAASLDPKLKWHTATTEHFVVYWYDGEEIIAKRILEICEPVRAKVVKAVDYAPKGKTHLVLTDITDSANGFALTIPYNSIRLFITGPTEGSSLDSYDDSSRSEPAPTTRPRSRCGSRGGRRSLSPGVPASAT